LAKEVGCEPLFFHSLTLSLPAPGFQTNVRQLKITPEIAARLRRGEDVSPEEIAEAARKAELEPPRPLLPLRDIVEINLTQQPQAEAEKSAESTNEWLPENVTAPKKRSKGKKK
jgi:hypothetical protein